MKSQVMHVQLTVEQGRVCCGTLEAFVINGVLVLAS